jgi:5-methylcytosine-specific restriction endonuclease McrA
MHRRKHPLCCDPFKSHGMLPPLMALVNHIVPLRVCYETSRPELAYNLDNLASLCTACDARIGAMERRGEDTTYLFNQQKEP